MGGDPDVVHDRPQLGVQARRLGRVAGPVGQVDLPVAVDGHPVVRPRDVLGGQPEVHRVPGHLVQAEVRRELGQRRLLAPHGRRVRLPDHLDVAQRPRAVAPGEVEVVEPERLLEHGVVGLLVQRYHRVAVVEHVVAAYLARSVGQAGRVLVRRRPEQDPGAVGRPGRDHHDVAAVRLGSTIARHHHRSHRRARSVRLQPLHLGVDQEGDVGPVQHGPDRDDLSVRLGMDQAREAVAGVAANAGAERPVSLVQQDPARRVERTVTGGGQRVGDLLDPRRVRDGGPRVLPGPVALGEILAVRAAYLVEPFGLGVPRLEVVVAQRPGRGQPVDVLDLAEVRRAQPVQRRAVHFGRPAHEVVHLRLERPAVGVVPRIGRDVPVVDEDRLRVPVGQFTDQEVAAFQEQDLLTGLREHVGQRPAAGPGAHDDDVIVIGHSLMMPAPG